MRISACTRGRVQVGPATRWPRRTLAAACVSALACGAVLACGSVAATTPGGRHTGALDSRRSAASLDRDCGFSAAVAGGRALWLFCDTQVYDRDGALGVFIPGATAAEGPYVKGEVPTTLREIPKPPHSVSRYPYDAAPQQFLPPPKDVYAPGGATCSGTGRYAASWPSGLTTIPTRNALLVVYDEVCVDDGFPSVEGLAMREYNPSTNTLSNPYEVFKPSSSGAALPDPEQTGSPIFSSGRLYMFSGTCSERDEYGDCVGGAVYLMRARAGSHYTNPKGYEWETPGGWSRSSSSASSIVAGAAPEDPAAVTVNSYAGEGLALIAETNLGGGYQVWLAPSGNPGAGHWTPGPSATTLPGCSAGTGLNLCRALTGHPEISSSHDMLMSYFDPQINRVYLVAVPWRRTSLAVLRKRGRSASPTAPRSPSGASAPRALPSCFTQPALCSGSKR